MTSRRLLSPVAKLLLEAADYIETNGHHKSALYKDGDNPHPPACALGALMTAAQLETRRVINGQPQEVRIANYELANLALAFQTGVAGREYIATWNDDPTRTPDDVIAALRAAAIATQQKDA